MLEICVGNIASGKSTYCQKRAEEGAVIVNDDNIVKAVHNGDYNLYNKKLKSLYKLIENTIVVHALALGYDVVIDRPNNKRATRARYISLAQSLDVPYKIVKFKQEHPEIHATRRHRHDSRGYSLEYWTEVATRRQKEFEPITTEELANGVCE